MLSHQLFQFCKARGHTFSNPLDLSVSLSKLLGIVIHMLVNLSELCDDGRVCHFQSRINLSQSNVMDARQFAHRLHLALIQMGNTLCMEALIPLEALQSIIEFVESL